MASIESAGYQWFVRVLPGLVCAPLHEAVDGIRRSLQTAVCGDRRIPFIVSCRGDELGVPARAFVEALIAAGGERIDLAPLAPHEVAELLESLEIPDLQAERLDPDIARHTGGNPFFVLETEK